MRTNGAQLERRSRRPAHPSCCAFRPLAELPSKKPRQGQQEMSSVVRENRALGVCTLYNTREVQNRYRLLSSVKNHMLLIKYFIFREFCIGASWKRPPLYVLETPRFQEV